MTPGEWLALAGIALLLVSELVAIVGVGAVLHRDVRDARKELTTIAETAADLLVRVAVVESHLGLRAGAPRPYRRLTDPLPPPPMMQDPPPPPPDD